MTKFTATNALDLRTPERDAGRVARKVGLLVTVEADDGSWFELDATDIKHATIMANDVVDKAHARGASCWRVERGGQIAEKTFYTYYHQ